MCFRFARIYLIVKLRKEQEMNEELVNDKIKYYLKTLQTPNFEDWTDYWRNRTWTAKDGYLLVTTEKLLYAAKDAFDHQLRHSEINDKLFPSNDTSEEEIAAWDFSLRYLYCKYVYDLPNYFINRDTTTLELTRGRRVNMRKFFNGKAWVLEDANVLLPIIVDSKERIQEIYNEIEINHRFW